MMQQTIPSPRHRRFLDVLRRPGPLLAIVLAFALALRLSISALIYASTFDTSTVGLMALNILKGERPLFFYGQHYMGALEAYLAALLFRLLGFSMVTLSLSPILFSIGWIAGRYSLFRELLDHKAGLAAALVLAIPGWHILWYNIASYGGYPGAFCLGIWAMWLCLRMARRDLSPGAEWAHILLLGFLAGVALWTNYQSASYLLTGALLLVPYLIRRRLAPRLLGKLAVGAVVFAAGFLPVFMSYANHEGTPVAEWNIKWSYISKTTNIMSERCFPKLFFWPLNIPPVLTKAVIICFVLACCLYLLRVVLSSDKKDRLRVLLPLLFSVVFLILYLPHSMASLGAPRYLIPLWSMILCAAFAVPVTLRRPWLRRSAWGLLAVWLSYNAVCGIFLGLQRAPKKREKVAARRQVVENARRVGATSVMLVGGPIFGHKGQTLSLYAKGDIRFVSVFNERHQTSAQAAEADPNGILACEKAKLKKVKATLDHLGVDYSLADDPHVCLLYDLKIPRRERKSIPPSEMRITLNDCSSGEAGYLTDRTRETCVEGLFTDNSGFTIDLGKNRVLDGFWLTASDFYKFGLPKGYIISSSLNGRDYEVIRRVENRIAAAYTCGNHVYLKGYFSLLESRFGPVTAQYLRLQCKSGQSKTQNWQINEVFVFEHIDTDPIDLDAEVTEIASTIKRLQLDFTICDRWLSARLWNRLPVADNGPPVYPRFNPKYRSTLLRRRVKPRKGLALAPSSSVADECISLLEEIYGPNVVAQRIVFANYTILVLNDAHVSDEAGIPLIWNGHTLLKTSDPNAGVYSDSPTLP